MKNLDTDIQAYKERLLYQKPIALYFGGPWTERQQKLLEKCAINWNRSLEWVTFDYFRGLIKRFCENTTDDGRNYFDLSIYIHSGIKDVYSPGVVIDSYVLNGNKYPRLIFRDGFIRDGNKVKRFFLKDNVVDLLGRDIENHSEYEYIEFKRLKNIQ